MKRHAAREKAFQLLFQLDINQNEPRKALDTFFESNDHDVFLSSLVEGVITHIDEIDKIIAENLENWSLNRIATVEKTILRMAAFEITYLDDIPKAVSINEAVELANKYGDEKSGKFINGVLSKLR